MLHEIKEVTIFSPINFVFWHAHLMCWLIAKSFMIFGYEARAAQSRQRHALCGFQMEPSAVREDTLFSLEALVMGASRMYMQNIF